MDKIVNAYHGVQLAFVRVLAFTPSLPSSKNVSIPGFSTFRGLINEAATGLTLVCLLGFIGSALFFIVESKRGHGSGMHTGHRLLVGTMIACLIIGGASAIVPKLLGIGHSI